MSDMSQALYRNNLVAFAERAMFELEPGTKLKINWHHHAVAAQLERCRNGEITQLVVNQPPKTLKTHELSISYVAQLIGEQPGVKVAIVCYDTTLATKIARSIRTILRSTWYQALYPAARVREDKDSESYFETTQGGEVHAISVQGGFTGKGFDYIIMDDPMKASDASSPAERRKLEEIFASSIITRFRNQDKGVLILVMQRLHVDDFTAYILRKYKSAKHLCLPAKAPKSMTYDLGNGRTRVFRKGELLEPGRITDHYLETALSQQLTQVALS